MTGYNREYKINIRFEDVGGPVEVRVLPPGLEVVQDGEVNPKAKTEVLTADALDSILNRTDPSRTDIADTQDNRSITRHIRVE
jgi:hypothetical protein